MLAYDFDKDFEEIEIGHAIHGQVISNNKHYAEFNKCLPRVSWSHH